MKLQAGQYVRGQLQYPQLQLGDMASSRRILHDENRSAVGESGRACRHNGTVTLLPPQIRANKRRAYMAVLNGLAALWYTSFDYA